MKDMTTMKEEFKITRDSKGKDLASFALALHKIVKLPLAIRSMNERGLRIEDGEIIDYDYTGPVLEQVLRENKLIRTVPTIGNYRGKSVIAAPIRDDEDNVIAAIAISDTYGAIDFVECFCRNPTVVKDVEECLMRKQKSKNNLKVD